MHSSAYDLDTDSTDTESNESQDSTFLSHLIRSLAGQYEIPYLDDNGDFGASSSSLDALILL